MDKKVQAENIEKLIKLSDNREKDSVAIREAYEAYLSDRSDWNFQELVRLTDTRCKPMVFWRLKNKELLTESNVNEVLHNARLFIWQEINSSESDYSTQSDYSAQTFPGFAYNVYKNKTLELITDIFRARRKDERWTVRGEGDGPVPDPETSIDETRKLRKIYSIGIVSYCRALLDLDEALQGCLALFYSRVLPHMLKSIKYTKDTSPKWAFERMYGLAVKTLTADSETTLKKDICADLAWNENLLKQLNDEIEILGRSLSLGDLIYTDAYDQRKIAYWAYELHKKTMVAAVLLMRNNVDLQRLLAGVYSEDCFLFKYFE